MQVALWMLMVGGYLDMVGSEGCVLASDYICKFIPQSFPPGLSSIVLLVSNLGEINSTTFSSEALQSVSSLTIANAGITTVSSGAFQSFCQLKKLSLYRNNLSQISASWFCQPASLENLTLFQNNIEILEEHSLAGLSGLTSLNLADNNIRTIAPRSFHTQKRLAHLDLSGNKLTRLSPEILLPLNATLMRLDGNPWDCSCDVKDFVVFLKGMINRSLLENEMDVICETPAVLKGQNVQNVSACIPPSEYASDKNILLQIVPAVIGFLGAFCILLCVACVLFKKKQKPKKVDPGLDSPGKKSFLDEKGTESKRWDTGDRKQGAWPLRDGGMRRRAQSAAAVLSTRTFPHQRFRTEEEGWPGHTELSTRTVPHQRFHTAEEGCPGHTELHEQNAHYINMSDTNSTEEQDTGRHILESMLAQAAENLPYLSIGSNPANHSTVDPEDRQGDNTGHGRREAIRRTSTWPITLYQWRKQHTSEDETFRHLLHNTADRSKIICNMSECLDGFEREDVSPESHQRDSVDGVFSRADRRSAVEEDDPSAIKSATFEEGTVLLCLHEQPATQSHTCSYQVSDTETHFPGQEGKQSEPRDEPDEPYSPSPIPGCEWEMVREIPATHGKAQEEGCASRSGGSQASRHRISPQDPPDENLLRGNEYAFIDLLHEVVENQGRWTRDRWKQSHLNKQRANKLSHTH